MFNIGFSELLILAIIGLIVIGPEQLPEMARKIAKILNELKRAKEEIFSPIDEFKNDALRAVDRVRQEAEKVQTQVNDQLKNQVDGIADKVNPNVLKSDLSAANNNISSDTIADHGPEKITNPEDEPPKTSASKGSSGTPD